MSLIEKLRGSAANFIQHVVSFVLSVTMLFINVLTDDSTTYRSEVLMSSMFMVVTMINATNLMRNRHIVELLPVVSSEELQTSLTNTLSGSWWFVRMTYLSAVGAFVTAMSYAALSNDSVGSVVSSVLFLAMASINLAKTVRDQSDAFNFFTVKAYEIIIAKLSAGTYVYAVVNVVCSAFSFVLSVVRIALIENMDAFKKFACIISLIFMVVSAVNMSKLVRDPNEANSWGWKILTVVAFVLSLVACFGVPLAMSLDRPDLLFIETNCLWVLSSTLTCSKIIRDIHETQS